MLIPAARRHASLRAGAVGVLYAVTLVTFVLATRLTTSANAIYLQSTAPLYLLLLAPWLLREPLTRRDVPVLLAVLGGLILVFLGNDAPSVTAPDPVRGNLLAVTSGVCYAVMLLGLRWLGRGGEDHGEGISAVLLGNVIACVATLPLALPLVQPGVVDLAVVAFLGIFQIGIAYALVTVGLRQVPALQASLLLLIETALNPAWTWALLGEVPTTSALAGGGLIVAGTILQARPVPHSAVEVTPG